jgi:hypothetical protein
MKIFIFKMPWRCLATRLQQRGLSILLNISSLNYCKYNARYNNICGREEGVRKKGDPRFLFSPIRPILPLLPVLTLQKCKAMLRCQIKRQKKTDPKEPYIIKTSSKHNKERNICIHPNMYGKAQRAKTKQTFEFCVSLRFRVRLPT